MYHIIDIIKTKHIDGTITNWKKIVKFLSKNDGFISGSLFRVVKSLDQSSYQLMSIFVWHKVDQHKIAREKFFENNDISSFKNNDTVFETTVCNLHKNFKKEYNKFKNSIMVVNPYAIKNEQINDFILMWEQVKNYMKNRNGLIQANLYKTTNPDSKYKCISMAEWENEEKFMAPFENNKLKKMIEVYQPYFSIFISEPIEELIV